MANISHIGFDEIDYKIIEFLQSCGMEELVAQTYMVYLGQIYPHMSVAETKENAFAALKRYLEQEQDLPIGDASAYLRLLALDGFLDNLEPKYIESVICKYIERQNLPFEIESNLKAGLPAIMSLFGQKLDSYGENRRQHYLHEPAQWAISKESKKSFLAALEDADRAIKLPALSGETFFESWDIGSRLIKKLRQGVDVKILFVHPELASRMEGKELAKTLAQKTVAITEHFLHEVDRELKSDRLNRQRKLGKLEIRWIRKEKFGYFTGLLTYNKDHQSPGVEVARLNIHRIRRERATVGLMLACDNQIGDTSLFKILETYFDEAWEKAEPLSGIRMWSSRVVNFSISYYGVILTSLVIVAMLFFVNPVVANTLIFIYPVVLTLLWRRHDNMK